MPIPDKLQITLSAKEVQRLKRIIGLVDGSTNLRDEDQTLIHKLTDQIGLFQALRK